MRFLPTMIRVNDLEEILLRYLRHEADSTRDYPSGKFTIAFVGYGDEAQTRSSN